MPNLEKSGQICFIDTNIWLYAFIETQDKRKSEAAKSLIRESKIVVSSQIINEVCVNLIKKASFKEDQVQRLIQSFYNKYSVIEVGYEMILEASRLRMKYAFSFWDSLVVAGALFSGSKILYSEDMQHHFSIQEKFIIKNPFRI